jgi:uncharacterized protein (TIGR00369 family)
MNAHSAEEALQDAGWRALAPKGFAGLVGPLWARREAGGALALGILAGESHLNPGGFVHGGLLATLLDHMVSTAAWEAADRVPCVTVQLDTKYLGAVAAGSFLEARASVLRKTRELVFAQGELRVENEIVATGTAVLKIVRPRD